MNVSLLMMMGLVLILGRAEEIVKLYFQSEREVAPDLPSVKEHFFRTIIPVLIWTTTKCSD